jgi:dihydroorotase
MSNIIIKDGRVIDPASNYDKVSDVLIVDGKIKKIGNVSEKGEIINAKGKIVCPGFIDMHVHLREPGREDKETIETCSKAAANGGFTTIVGMPNTTPVADDQTVVGYVVEKGRNAVVNVYPVGAMTKKSESREIAQIGDLVKAGAVAVSDDGWPVKDNGLMHKALMYIKKFGIPYVSHSEDISLAGDGVMHEGKVSTELGLAGKPASAEAIGIAKEIILAEETGSRIHFTHISTKMSVELIKDAKKRKVKVSCDSCPHYFSLTDEAVKGYNPNAKMSPPLRSEDHRRAIIKGLKEGAIDAIASDHAPHLLVEKMLEFEHCENGIVGLETSVPLAFDILFHKEKFDLMRLISLFTVGPATVLGLDKGKLQVGSDADVTIIDPSVVKKVDKSKFLSKGRNTPFDGWELKGWPVATIVGGKVVYWE